MGSHGAEMQYGVFDEALRHRLIAQTADFRTETDRFAKASLLRRVSHSADYARTTETEWLYDCIWRFFIQFNHGYGFVISGVEAPIQLMKYGPGGCVDWHIDDGNGNGQENEQVRKLSMSIQLTADGDYAGGDFEFAGVPTDSFSRIVGTAICFPSYCVHRITPLTAGARTSLLCFALGPPFR